MKDGAGKSIDFFPIDFLHSFSNSHTVGSPSPLLPLSLELLFLSLLSLSLLFSHYYLLRTHQSTLLLFSFSPFLSPSLSLELFSLLYHSASLLSSLYFSCGLSRSSLCLSLLSHSIRAVSTLLPLSLTRSDSHFNTLSLSLPISLFLFLSLSSFIFLFFSFSLSFSIFFLSFTHSLSLISDKVIFDDVMKCFHCVNTYHQNTLSHTVTHTLTILASLITCYVSSFELGMMERLRQREREREERERERVVVYLILVITTLNISTQINQSIGLYG